MLSHLSHGLLGHLVLFLLLLSLGGICEAVQVVSRDLRGLHVRAGGRCHALLGGRRRQVLSKHYDLILGLGEFPASEDEQVGSNSCAGVPVALRRRVTDVAAFFP